LIALKQQLGDTETVRKITATAKNSAANTEESYMSECIPRDEELPMTFRQLSLVLRLLVCAQGVPFHYM
jgi:hypothetical protein